MLTEHERNEVVASVARDLGVAVSPNDPVFVGLSLFMQGGAINAGGSGTAGIALSNAGEAVIGMR